MEVTEETVNKDIMAVERVKNSRSDTDTLCADTLTTKVLSFTAR